MVFDGGFIFVFVLLDFSVVFDIVDYNILLEWLEYVVGIIGIVL